MIFLIIPNQTGIFEVARLLPHEGKALQYINGTVFKVHEENGVAMIGIKELYASNPYFQGHFPNRPMYPGHAIDEGVDLVCGCLGVLEYPLRKTQTIYAKSETKFRAPAFPGDTLTFIARPGRKKEINGQMIMTFNGVVTNQKDEIICERSVVGAGA